MTEAPDEDGDDEEGEVREWVMETAEKVIEEDRELLDRLAER